MLLLVLVLLAPSLRRRCIHPVCAACVPAPPMRPLRLPLRLPRPHPRRRSALCHSALRSRGRSRHARCGCRPRIPHGIRQLALSVVALLTPPRRLMRGTCLAAIAATATAGSSHALRCSGLSGCGCSGRGLPPPLLQQLPPMLLRNHLHKCTPHYLSWAHAMLGSTVRHRISYQRITCHTPHKSHPNHRPLPPPPRPARLPSRKRCRTLNSCRTASTAGHSGPGLRGGLRGRSGSRPPPRARSSSHMGTRLSSSCWSAPASSSRTRTAWGRGARRRDAGTLRTLLGASLVCAPGGKIGLMCRARRWAGRQPGGPTGRASPE